MLLSIFQLLWSFYQVIELLNSFCFAYIHQGLFGLPANIPTIELVALFDLFNSTNGNTWIWQGPDGHWNFSGDPEPCDPSDIWQGLNCTIVDDQFFVQQIILEEYNLTGTLPLSIGNFSYLNYFDVSYNSLIGTIPDTLFNNTQLQVLYLNNNQLMGSISARVGQLTQLQHLDGNLNDLVGSIPEEIGDAVSLQYMYLASNHLTGSIPFSITKLSNLIGLDIQSNDLGGELSRVDWSSLVSFYFFYAFDNYFNGTLPRSLLELPSLSYLSLNHNELVGSIPDLWKEGCPMNILELSDNHFTGTLPASLGNCTDMNYIFMFDNHLTQSIPPSYGNLSSMTEFSVSNNLLTGSLPLKFLCEMEFLSYFSLSLNGLEGPIACGSGVNFTRLLTFGIELNSFTGEWSRWNAPLLGSFSVNNNHFSGTIFDWFQDKALTSLFLYNNLFSGTIGPEIADNVWINDIQIYSNLLSGTLPKLLGGFANLSQFLANNNAFEGPLGGVFNTSSQKYLSRVDVSSNQLSGTLPEDLFHVSSELVLFGAAVNCFHGSIPRQICDCRQLTGVILDGLLSATSCQKRFFPGSQKYQAYYFAQPISGTIPKCLFEMDQLGTLHLSGNGIAGTIPEDVLLSLSLLDLSLSHNRLSGTIPQQFQEKQWSSLDLSYNKLTGLLSDFSHQSNATSLSLEVNRLSGVLPGSVIEIEDINILNGNKFLCNSRGNGLPSHDGKANTYECGSSSMDVAMIVFATLLVAVGLVVAVIVKYQNVVRQLEWIQATRSCGALKEFCTFLVTVRWSVSRICVVCLMVFMPTYIALSHYYHSFSESYIWIVSAAYLSGYLPAILLFLLWTVVLYFMRLRSTATCTEDMTAFTTSKFEKVVSLFLILVNCLIVTLVNIAYVYVNNHFNGVKVVAMQFAVVSYKILWNSSFVPYVLYILHKNYFTSVGFKLFATRILSGIVLFNNLAAPFIATAFISPNCFYNVIVTPEKVSTSFESTSCIFEFFEGNDEYCSSYTTTVTTTSYIPPYIYSYQCASTFISDYAEVFVYMYLQIAFITPLIQFVLYEGIQRGYVDPKRFWIFRNMQWKLLRDHTLNDTDDAKLQLTKRLEIFRANVFVCELLSAIGILMTFGVVFPPLSVVIFVAIVVVTHITELLVGRLLVTDRYNQEFRDKLVMDCNQLVSLFAESMWVVTPFVSLFYAYLLFDTLGDAVDWQNALWLPLTVLGLPVVTWLGLRVWKRVLAATKESIKQDVEMHSSVVTRDSRVGTES